MILGDNDLTMVQVIDITKNRAKIAELLRDRAMLETRVDLFGGIE